MRKMFVLSAVLLVLVVMLASGCAGTMKGYSARGKAIAAKYDDIAAFYEAQKKGYVSGQGGGVQESGVKNEAPVHLEFGYAINLNTCPVNIVINGPVSRVISLPAAFDPNQPGRQRVLAIIPVMRKMDLAANGLYQIKYYRDGESNSYSSTDDFYLGDQGGDTKATGIIAEEYEEAVNNRTAIPKITHLTCDFSIIAK